jgi:glycine/D-amino acid oxidase-like deaminating enzyme
MRPIFPNYQLASGWNALLPPRQAHAPLKGKQVADVVIVGAGFTGLACARRWQELAPDARIVVIDASEIGEGNPGRNSGFLLEIALAEDANPENMQRMLEANRLTQNAMQSILSNVQASGLDVDLQRAGTYRGAASSAGLKSLNNYKQFLEGAGLPYRSLDQTQLKAELGTDFYQSGLYSPHCYLAQPAAVIRAIHSQLADSITLFENTPALKINNSDGKWTVTTAEGEMTCSNLVLANNSFAKEQGIARSRLAGIYTYAGITPPLDPELLDSLGSVHNWGLLPTHRLGSTLRRTADDRLLVRSGHSYEAELSGSKVTDFLQDRLWRRFPQLNLNGQGRGRAQAFEHVWGGAVGVTLNSAPVWGEREPGLFISSGCNGGGTVKGTLLGSALAELALGHSALDVAAIFGSPIWMPPDPLRRIGFEASAVLESWQGRREL